MMTIGYVIYYLCSAFSLVWAAAVFTLGFIPTMLCLLQSYAFQQLGFALGHVLAHARIIEHQNVYLLGFHHHYQTSRSLADNWLWNRLALFLPVHRALCMTEVHVGLCVLAVVFSSVMGFTFGAAVCLSMVFFWQNVSAISHEFYHLPVANRSKHFTYPILICLELLDMVYVLDSKRHKVHHQHTINTLFEVRDFFQLRVPDFINELMNSYWALLVRSHIPGKDRMTKISVVVVVSIVIPTTAAHAWTASFYFR